MPDIKVFIDANILLYFHDKRSPEKSVSSENWINYLAARKAAVVNLQVLNETTNVLLNKDWHDAAQCVFLDIDDFIQFGDDPITLHTTKLARNVIFDTNFSWWDCLLLASAMELDCSHFLSEDLADGQIVKNTGHRNLMIINPFTHTPDELFGL